MAEACPPPVPAGPGGSRPCSRGQLHLPPGLVKAPGSRSTLQTHGGHPLYRAVCELVLGRFEWPDSPGTPLFCCGGSHGLQGCEVGVTQPSPLPPLTCSPAGVPGPLGFTVGGHQPPPPRPKAQRSLSASPWSLCSHRSSSRDALPPLSSAESRSAFYLFIGLSVRLSTCPPSTHLSALTSIRLSTSPVGGSPTLTFCPSASAQV